MKTAYNLNLYENILTLFIFCSNKLNINTYMIHTYAINAQLSYLYKHGQS